MTSLFWGCLFRNYYRIVTIKLGNLIISICGVFHIRYIFNFSRHPFINSQSLFLNLFPALPDL
jgi:hypothetical protein